MSAKNYLDPIPKQDRSLVNNNPSLARRWIVLFTLLALYLPYAWVFLIDYRWDSYHWYWAKLYPVLPGITPAVFLGLRILPQWSLPVISGGFTLTFLIVALLAGFRLGRSKLFVLYAAILVLSCALSFFAYGIFAA
jgi:hypothetical protein